MSDAEFRNAIEELLIRWQFDQIVAHFNESADA